MRLPHVPPRLMAAIGLGACSVFLVLTYVSGAERKLQERYEGIRVLVASRDIAENTLMTPAMVRFLPMPRDHAVEGALTRLSQLGQEVSTVKVLKGDQLSSRKLANKESIESRYVDIPDGMRAVTITPDESAEACSLVRPGDSVDIVLTYDQGVDSSSRTVVVENIRVARRPTVYREAGSTTDLAGDTPSAVTLIVSQGQAETLAYADEFGKIRLLLRPAPSHSGSDSTTAGTRSPGAVGVTIDSLKAPMVAPAAPRAAASAPRRRASARHNPPQTTSIPAKPPMAETSVEVIRGTETSSVAVAR